MSENKSFTPEWCSPPGNTIQDLMTRKGIVKSSLISELGLNSKGFESLINGDMRITLSLAALLSSNLGGSKEFWMNRDYMYIEDLKFIKNKEEQWLKELPVSDMYKYGWISKTKDNDIMQDCLAFFGVLNLQEWNCQYTSVLSNVAFRISESYRSRRASIAAWLRKGIIESDNQKTCPFDKEKVLGRISDLKSLSKKNDPKIFFPLLQKSCSDCGVSVHVIKAPDGCRASGAALLKNDKGILLLSNRYKTDDHFWFTFFHELGHLVMHAKSVLHVDEEIAGNVDRHEEEANAFAHNCIIPEEYKGAFLELRGKSHRDIIRFATMLRVSPGVIVGQMQYNKLAPVNYFNKLKRSYEWD